MTTGLDRLVKLWPLIVFAVVVIVAAAEVRVAVAENEKDITEVREQQQRVEDALKKQAEVNGTINQRTITIQDQLKELRQLVIDGLRDKER